MTDLRAQLQNTLGDAYILERELGGGGMSRVFVARETALGREVVVKVLAPELAAGVSAERFAREIATAARLQQANIVPVLAAGASGGMPYYTMPFVKGESLRSMLSSGTPLSMADRIGVLRDVARALAYAHAEGVIHRDIKPDNILLSGGAAVVTDFGIAKAISASRTLDGHVSEAADGTLTQVGSSIGTPAYMAPEQAVGEHIDHRADLYAWGVVAYELLAGAHPFAGKSGTSQLIAAHIAEVPTSLTARNADIPRDVAELVMQCLAKNPAQRPENANVLRTRLSIIVTPNAERTTAPPLRTSRFKFAVPAVALMLASAGVYAWSSRRAPPTTSPSRSVVVIPFDNLGDSTDAYFAEGVSEDIGSQLARIPGLQVIARTGVQRYRGSNKSPLEIAKELGAAYVLSGSVRWARAAGSGTVNGDTRVRIVPTLLNVETGLQEWGESFNEPLTDVFKVQADVAERVATALSIALGTAEQAVLRRRDSNDPEARDAQLLGRHFLRQRGLPNLRRAVTEFRRAIARDSLYARAWAGYAEAYVLLPSYFDTISTSRALAEAQRAAERAVALDSMLPEAHVALARALWTDFKFNAALPAIDRAIRLDPSSVLALQQRYETLMALGRVEEGDATIRRALALDGLVPLLHFEQAISFFASDQLDSALGAVDRAIALDTDHSAYWHGQRWAILQHLDRRDEAVRSCVTFAGDALRCRALSLSRAPTPGERDAARRVLTGVARDPSATPWLPLTAQALVYVWLGDTEVAFDRLRAAVEQRDPNVLSLTYFPGFRPLRGNPRWATLLESIRSR
ncbi:MAG: protein kinase [Gemmatimonadaceae bacterium]|nr:protein kinase [Gemmatimonadaceae bacterium]